MNNAERRALVHDQLERRLRVLETWLEEGVPDGEWVPASLNQARTWDAPSLGIEPIRSSATFATTHRVHGALVSHISKLVLALAAQHRPRRPGKKKLAAERNAQRAATKRMLEAAANQYAALSVELHEARIDFRVTKQSLDAVRAENAHLREENAQLRRAFVRRSSPSVVSVLDSSRPGSVPGNGC